MSDPLSAAIQAVQAGDHATGRHLLARIIRAEPGNELAWLWMSAVVTNDDQRRDCLERVLRLNPQNQAALSGLAQLQQQRSTLMPEPATHRPAGSSESNAEPGVTAADLLQGTTQTDAERSGEMAVDAVADTGSEAFRPRQPSSPSHQPSPQPQAAPMTDAPPDLQTLKATLTFRALGKPLLAVVGGAGFSALSFFAAIDAASGVRPEIRGRYQMVKHIYAWLIITLGPWGVLVAGSLCTGAALVWLALRVRALTSALRLLEVSTPAGETMRSVTPTIHQARPAEHRAPAPSHRHHLALRVLLGLLIVAACVFWWFAPRLPQMLYDRQRAAAISQGAQPGLIEGGVVIDLSNRGFVKLSFQEHNVANVVLLDFSGNPLSTFPTGLEHFHQLEHLYIQGTPLTHLSPEIGKLSTLRTLVLANNQLVELPPELGQLQNLETLDLRNNQLETLPPELAQLPSTTKILIEGNPLRKEALPPSLQKRLGA